MDVEERLLQAPPCGRLPGEVDLAPVGGVVLPGIGGAEVVESPSGPASPEYSKPTSSPAMRRQNQPQSTSAMWADEPEQRQARRQGGALAKPAYGQAAAPAQQDLAVKIQPRLQHLPLTGDIQRVLADDLRH